jgi:ABC-type nitrate/sulfonate/bicarbonate transport system ATPase subunit
LKKAINLSDVIVVMTKRPGKVKEIIRCSRTPQNGGRYTGVYTRIRRHMRELIAGGGDVSEPR